MHLEIRAVNPPAPWIYVNRKNVAQPKKKKKLGTLFFPLQCLYSGCYILACKYKFRSIRNLAGSYSNTCRSIVTCEEKECNIVEL
jgi:hypothetical protein